MTIAIDEFRGTLREQRELIVGPVGFDDRDRPNVE
jgi:hypothetical protein